MTGETWGEVHQKKCTERSDHLTDFHSGGKVRLPKERVC